MESTSIMNNMNVRVPEIMMMSKSCDSLYNHHVIDSMEWTRLFLYYFTDCALPFNVVVWFVALPFWISDDIQITDVSIVIEPISTTFMPSSREHLTSFMGISSWSDLTRTSSCEMYLLLLFSTLILWLVNVMCPLLHWADLFVTLSNRLCGSVISLRLQSLKAVPFQTVLSPDLPFMVHSNVMMLQLQGKALTVTVLMICRLLAPALYQYNVTYQFRYHAASMHMLWELWVIYRTYLILELDRADINSIANSIAVNKYLVSHLLGHSILLCG